MAKSRSGQGKMTVEEAGRKGGAATAQARGREFYQEIGRKGGEARRGKLGSEGYRELGRKGGAATSQKRAPEPQSPDDGGHTSGVMHADAGPTLTEAGVPLGEAGKKPEPVREPS